MKKPYTFNEQNKEGEVKRKDQTRFLGRNLVPRQQRIYNIIFASGDKPIGTKKIVKQLNDGELPEDLRSARNHIHGDVRRIRSKLGELSIITEVEKGRYLGYRARRAVIEQKYPSQE